MDPRNIRYRYDPVRLGLAQQAAEEVFDEYRREEEEEEDDTPVTRSFEPAVLTEFYKYQRIEEPWTTRILVLHPGEEADRLRGHLETLWVGRSGQEEYEALSYVWGKWHTPEAIDINGKRLAITKSLGAALRRCRPPSGGGTGRCRPLRIWVDQICINQQDNVERSQQVQLMHAIFKGAARVRVWLGRHDQGGLAPLAFQLCRSLCAILDDELLAALCRRAGASFDWIPKRHWQALRAMAARPWFRRAWIPQEIGTDAPATVHWGSGDTAAEIEWEVLVRAMQQLESCWELRKQQQIDTSAVTLLYRRFVEHHDDDDNDNNNNNNKEARCNFVYQLCLSRRNVATDLRDYVFSQLGHYSAWVASENEVIIQPDYDNSVAAIYHEIAIRSFKTCPHLTILNAVSDPGSGEGSGGATAAASAAVGDTWDLPSWVPRWDTGQLYSMIGYPGRYKNYPGRVKDPAGVAFENDFRTLVLKGKIIGNIAKITSKFVPECFDPGQGKRRLLRTAWSLATDEKIKVTVPNSILPTGSSLLAFSLQPRYPRNPSISALEAFLDVLAPSACIADIAPTASSFESGIAALSKVLQADHNYAKKHDPRKKDGVDDKLKAQPSAWLQVVEDHAVNRRFAVTDSGHFVMVPPSAKRGDLLCVLYGGETPYVLRTKTSGDGYTFIGEAYEHTVMHGPSIPDIREGPTNTFRIR